jgi:sulfatase modifying factor 1
MRRRAAAFAMLSAATIPVAVWAWTHAGAPLPHGACLAAPSLPDPHEPTGGMRHIMGGSFIMGGGAIRPDDGTPHRAHAGPFWIDATDVTNAQYAQFVAATGYRTLAERGLDAATYPSLSPAERQPASLVFVSAEPGVNMHDPGAWWRVVPGADWRHPQGPGSSIAGRENLPVVHMAYQDALAYAQWLGHDLPSEAEWEFAARGGLNSAHFVWGDQENPHGAIMANTWQGAFPVNDLAQDGYRARPSPVGCFPPNGFGLYDMAGNVWQWTHDIDTAQAQPGPAAHVIKGGSFLCAPNYCFRYRPAAREFGPADSGASHIGFRTVLRG